MSGNPEHTPREDTTGNSSARDVELHIVEAKGTSDLADMMGVAGSYAESDRDLNRTRDAITKELRECGSNRRVFLAHESARPIAFVELVLYRADNDPELADGQQVAHVHNLQVRKDAQGRGIGTALMCYLEKKARQMGKTKLTLGVDVGNARARRLYKWLGWQHMKDLRGPNGEDYGVYLYKAIE
jgi:ribosomal protein S18 acetylase RimI-like enzyme